MLVRLLAGVSTAITVLVLTALPAATASATSVNGCALDVDDDSDACMDYDSDGNGYVSPEVEIAGPEQAVAAGTQFVVTATGTDLLRPVTVGIHLVEGYDEVGASNLVASITVGPGALISSVTVPSGTGTTDYTAYVDDYDEAGVYVYDSFEVVVTTQPSTLASDLPPGRIVKAGTRSQAATGRVSGGARPVHLQTRAREGSWVSVASTTSNAEGIYTIGVPTFWVGKHTYRAHAPAFGAFSAVDGDKASTVTVKRAYKPTGSKAHTFLHGPGIRWNACTPITYALNPSRMPKWFVAEARYALREVSAATGLRFADRGRTDFIPFAKNLDPFDGNPEGIDLVLAWSTPKTVRELSGWTAGVGGAQSSGNALSDGGVALDASARLSRKVWREIILHEVGHAIGLGHVTDRNQVMRTGSSGSVTRYAKGDLTGLAALGAGAGACTALSESYLRGGIGQPGVVDAGPVGAVVLR